MTSHTSVPLEVSEFAPLHVECQESLESSSEPSLVYEILVLNDSSKQSAKDDIESVINNENEEETPITNTAHVIKDANIDSIWPNLSNVKEYHGVLLKEGVQRIDFNDGYYIGTVDLDGKFTGYGRMVWNSGDCYVGEWWCDAMHGSGSYTWADGDNYKGQYEFGEMSGQGEMQDANGLYIGDWAHDTRNGHGTMKYTNGNVYTGEWVNGNCHGQGKLFEIDCGATYEGMFENNVKHGVGIEINADGDVYDGEFVHGQPHGKGTYVWHDGTRYVGQFANGLPHGEGCEWLANGDWIAGNFINGEHDHVQPLHKAVIVSPSLSVPKINASAIGVCSTDKTRNTINKVINHVQDVKEGNANVAPQNALLANNNTTTTNSNNSNSNISANEINDHSMSSHYNTSQDERSNQVISTLTCSNNIPVHLLTEDELSHWTSLRVVGRGSFGAVHEARLPNGTIVCCKVVELGNVESAEQMTKVRNEMSVMRRLSHPNIVQYYGSVEDTEAHTLNIFMEFCSAGSLAKWLRQVRNEKSSVLSSSSSSRLKETLTNVAQIREWGRQVLRGVCYLHRHSVIHRDIKCDNILIGNTEQELKLADFGCSKAIHDVCGATHGCNTMVGTPYWMAPEVITCEQDETAYGMKSDIWSFGCTLVEMITGRPPWPECNSLWAAVYKIANSTGLPTEIPEDLDDTLRDLLYQCFERNPRNRPTAEELLCHPFFLNNTACNSK